MDANLQSMMRDRFPDGLWKAFDGEIAVAIDDIVVYLVEDHEHERIAAWTKLQPVAAHEAVAAAAAATTYSFDSYDSRSVAVGFAYEAGPPVLGRSVERRVVDAGSLETLLRDIAREAKIAQRAIDDALAMFHANASAQAEPAADGMIRV